MIYNAVRNKNYKVLMRFQYYIEKFNIYGQYKNLYSFLIIWLIINFIQAGFTELANDEAYYWMYSRFLDWGYFDHPPFIALIIRFGTLFFDGELGVRMVSVLLGTTTIYIIYLLAGKENNIRLFILLTSSVVIVHTHIGGFLAIPDMPVIFFSSLFLLLYKRYLEEDNAKLVIFIALTGIAMLYSKYHGILVMIFTLASNLKLLSRKSFWLIPLIISLGMLPHLIWQINNNFPTFQYHLVGRSSWYSLKHTIDYLLGQLLVANPIIAVILFYHAFRRKIKNSFERALKFNMIGFFLFFLISSFRGHVEPHWTAIAFIPAIVLSYKDITPEGKSARWLYRLFFPSIVIFLILRLALIINILPPNLFITKEFHNWDRSAKEIKSVAGDYKVVFINSFQRPSKYSFYTRDYAHGLNSVYYRRNQYDFWPIKDSLMNSKVIVMYSSEPDDSVKTSNGDIYHYKKYDNFRFYYDFKIEPEDYSLTSNPEEIVKTKISFTNTLTDSIEILTGLPDNQANIVMAYRPYGEEWLKQQTLKDIYGIKFEAGETKIFNIEFTAPEKYGEYWLYFGISNDYLQPRCQIAPVKLIVKNN